MNTLKSFLEIFPVELIGWSVIHTFWIGLIIWMLFLSVRHLFKLSASKRYMWAFSMQLLLFAGFLGSSLYVFNKQETNNIVMAKESQALKSNAILLKLNNTTSDEGLISEGFISFMQSISPILAYAWLLGAMLMMLRFTSSLFYIQNLRKTANTIKGDEWQAGLNELLMKTGIKRKVRLFESDLIDSPLTIGHFKPLILVPVSMISEIPPTQLEAILLHELAHIKRSDYLLNMIQNMVEALIFFHPVTWILSSEINRERENICDDFSVSIQKDPLQLARALFNVQMQARHLPDLAMGASKNKSMLKDRIERLVLNKRENNNFRKGIIPTVLIALVLISSLFINNATTNAASETSTDESNITRSQSEMLKPDKAPQIETADFSGFKTTDDIKAGTMVKPELKTPKQPKVEVQSNIPQGNDKVSIKKTSAEGKKIEIVFTSPEDIQKLKIDGKKIKKEDYDDYRELLDEEIFQSFGNKPQSKSYTITLSAEGESELVESEENSDSQTVIISDSQGGKQVIRLRNGDEQEMEIEIEALSEAMEEIENAFDDMEVDIDIDFDDEEMIELEEIIRSAESESMEKALREIERSLEKSKDALERNLEKLDQKMNEEEMQEIEEELSRAMEEVQRELERVQIESEKEMVKLRKLEEKLEIDNSSFDRSIEELKNDGIIDKDDENVSIEFNKGKMTVNGEKQNAEISTKYMKLLNISEKSVIHYERNK